MVQASKVTHLVIEVENEEDAVVNRSDDESRLLRVCTSGNVRLMTFREGVSLESSLGRSIPDLIAQVTTDRLQFADQRVAEGDKLLRLRPQMNRLAVGRFYYGMYHAVRAVVFFVNEGDDSQAHSELPKGLPPDFPDYRQVTNSLRDARRERNNADYDPYPSEELDFKYISQALQKISRSITIESRSYLKRKGCLYL